MTMSQPLPLQGIRVVELSHMVMGPSCGLVLGDLGAEVIKIEPVGEGDNTRRLPGTGAGFFVAFNRNKRSLALDVKSEKGLALARRLIARADVLLENFRPGGLDALGLGYEALRPENPGLIYCSLKGFLSGPYEKRAALDEVVQMMGGLAYMTGPPGRPLRAGAPVNDIMGGMFAVIGILAALQERHRTGRGQLVRSALFENNAFLVSPHVAQFAVTGKPATPMPARTSAWGIYDVFETGDDSQIFIAVVTDTQWRAFCEAFGQADLKADATLATNPQRVAGRERLLPARPALAVQDSDPGGDQPRVRGVQDRLCADPAARRVARRSAPGMPGRHDRDRVAARWLDADPGSADRDGRPALGQAPRYSARGRAQRGGRERARMRARADRGADRGGCPRHHAARGRASKPR
jgi:crotonobetainyl-CoA:carnitine CoA-transferase CaiB-like acyl-CoA transferase